MEVPFLTIIASIVYVVISCQDAQIDARKELNYRWIKTGYRSNKTVITRRKASTLENCMDFAETKRALAFNFGKDDLNLTDVEVFLGSTCVLYHCPEFEGEGRLVNITGSTYYSAYPTEIPAGKGTLFCVPSIGVFAIFTDRQNFTDAQATCKRFNGTMAEVTSYDRTRGLSKEVMDGRFFVGLSNHGGEKIWKNDYGNPLSCYDFRAWGTGEPSRSRGCVSLTRNTSNTAEPVWEVVPCNQELPFICELAPVWPNESTQMPKEIIKRISKSFFSPLPEIR